MNGAGTVLPKGHNAYNAPDGTAYINLNNGNSLNI
jgi:hypothetical protein